eukprot:1573165-Pleurochrysis_carterae.AAC.1
MGIALGPLRHLSRMREGCTDMPPSHLWNERVWLPLTSTVARTRGPLPTAFIFLSPSMPFSVTEPNCFGDSGRAKEEPALCRRRWTSCALDRQCAVTLSTTDHPRERRSSLPRYFPHPGAFGKMSLSN